MKNKLKKLRELGLINLDSNRENPDAIAFEDINELFRRARRIKILNRRIKRCRKCASSGLNLAGHSESAPGFGRLDAQIMLVGQSLCTQCMATQIPFTEKSGYYIDAALILSGLTRYDVFITNLIHCHPPGNRASTSQEIKNCRPFLAKEVEIIASSVIIGLGSDAKRALENTPMNATWPKRIFVKHPASFLYGSGKGVYNWIVELSEIFDEFKDK